MGRDSLKIFTCTGLSTFTPERQNVTAYPKAVFMDCISEEHIEATYFINDG